MNAERNVYRHEWYQAIHDRMPAILSDAQRARQALRCDRLPSGTGLYSGMSSGPGNLPDFVLDAIVESNRKGFTSVRSVEDNIRSVVKDLFGDACDCAVTNTCEAGLRVAIETLMAPPILRRGEMYRARMISLLSEDHDWAAAYGRPFPPKYKHITADRSVSAGELGMDAKCLENLDTVFVRCAGVRYETHGIRQNVVPIMLDLDVAATVEAVDQAALRHAGMLSGLTAIGYDTPGYGQAETGSSGAPLLLERLGAVARHYDVPFLIDCASCLPGLGFTPQDVNADVMAWSMDKVSRAPTCGLLVGPSEALLPIRRALGLGGQRQGHVSSHGKAVFSLADPGRDALVGLLAWLKKMASDPQSIVRPVRELHDIVIEELEVFSSRLRVGLTVTLSQHLGGIEINYARTWRDGAFGVPIFTLEDVYVDLNAICRAMEVMGVSPPSIYAGNILMTPGLGLVTPDGALADERARIAVRTLLKAIEIVCDHAGVEM